MVVLVQVYVSVIVLVGTPVSAVLVCSVTCEERDCALSDVVTQENFDVEKVHLILNGFIFKLYHS